jgi:hypothetical protein
MVRILYDGEIMKQLSQEFKGECGVRTIRYALCCQRHSELAKRIRKRAINMGAKVKGEETVKHL